MPNNSPTIVSAALSDKELQDSINAMVANFDRGLQTMLEHSNDYVGKIQSKLQEIGSTKFDFGGSNDSGASKQSKAQKDVETQIKSTTVAIEQQTQKVKENALSLDQQAAAMQTAKGGSGMSVMETYNMQIELLKTRLREVRQDIDIFNAAIGSGKKTQIEWGQQGLKQANAEAEKLMATITKLESQSGNLANIVAPQGHTIQNYVNSLQKANPELAQLNAQFKKGDALLQNQLSSFEQSERAIKRSSNATSQSKEALDEMNAYIRQNIQREQERRNAIMQTGVAAQETLNQLIKTAHARASKDGDTPLLSLKEFQQLQTALKDIRSAYYNMPVSERKSPIGLALEEDMKRAEIAIATIRKYHDTLSSITQQQGTGKITNSSTLSSLRESLKSLSEQYSKLTVAELNAGKGDALIQHFQNTSRAAQLLQNTLNRPVNLKAALQGDERTLDDIAYKMQRLRSYRQGIDLTKPNAANEIKAVDEALARLQKDADKWMSKSQEMIKSNTALGRSWNYMKNRLAFYFTVGASTQFIKSLIEVRSQYEMNERALGILINSAERGTQIFNELSQMALVSPYTLIELSAAAKQLTAYDIAAKDVVDTTRRLADMASAVGVPIERLTYALGQIKAYGYLNSRDQRMFANAGIPLAAELAKYYTEVEGKLVSTGDVYDRIKKKAVDYNTVMQVVYRMTDEGGKFFDFQAKMAETLKVQLANLTLAWNNMLNDLGNETQGVLSGAIGALKQLFLHWRDIDNILKTIALTFGLYKGAQMLSLMWTGRLTTAMGVQELVGKKLQARLASMTATNMGFVSAATLGWTALAAVVADVILTMSRNYEEIDRLNETIASGAKESAKALDEMLHSTEMVRARLSASTNKLAPTDAAKAWDMLREQIEMSASSSDLLIAKLLQEEDLNKRVTEAFNLAERIQSANKSLSEMLNSLDVSQDSILGGLFGEGLAEDIEDYNERLRYETELAEWASKKNKDFWGNAVMGLKGLFNEVKESLGRSEDEARREIERFAKEAAETIRGELGEEGMKDKIQVNEAVARVLKGMEQMFPQIRGKGKVLFETLFYDTMSTEFAGAVDKQAYYYRTFLNQLKKDHSSAFGDVTEDIIHDTHTWSSAQMDAIQKTADKVKKDLPEASQKAIDDILSQLNSTEFKVRIVAELATSSIDAVNKAFKDRWITKDALGNELPEQQQIENQQKYGSLMRKNGEDNVAYEKRISDERKKQLDISEKNGDIIDKNKNKQDAYSKAVTADAKKQKEAADAWLAAANDIGKSGGYDFSTKKENADARKAQKQAESELQKALKDEISILNQVRSTYKQLRKESVAAPKAIATAINGFDETVASINKRLSRFGIAPLDLSEFAGVQNPRKIMDKLKEQLNKLMKSPYVKPAEIKDLQVELSKINVESVTFDQRTLIDSMNSELGKLKDEYEMSVELSADPEMGNMFESMFGLDMSNFPKTIDEYMSRVQQEFDKARDKNKYKVPLNVFKANADKWEEWGKEVGLVTESLDEQGNVISKDTSALDTFKQKFVEAQGVAKKWATDTVKQTETLRYKLADTNGKIELANKKLQNLLSQREKETNKDQQNLLDLQIEEQKNEIAKLKEEVLQLLPTYKNLFNSIAEHSAVVTRRIAKQWKEALKIAVKNPDGTYTITDPTDPDKKATVTEKTYGAQIDKADAKLRETASTLQKIREAFKKNEDGTIDWAKGIELISEEMQKVGQLADVVGEIVEAFGNPNEYNETAEVLHDIANTISGISEASKGIAQIMNGDIIGGSVAVISGLWKAVSTWMDNRDKKISQSIKESERSVKDLENAYKNLQVAIDDAFGTNVIGAKQAAIANKELQLAELERQLALEKSRDSKHRDEDRIQDLTGQVIDLRNEINKSYKDIGNDLLGISSVADAAQGFMDAYITALRSGEDAMSSFNESVNDMIANLISKIFVTRVLGPRLEAIFDEWNQSLQKRSGDEAKRLEEAKKKQTDYSNMSDDEIRMAYMDEKWGSRVWGWTSEGMKEYASLTSEWVEAQRKQAEQEIKDAEKALNKATTPSKTDVGNLVTALRDIAPELAEQTQEIVDWINEFALMKSDATESNLSALQQGIQGITEDTAGALEAYMNGVSQQVYLQSEYLRQIAEVVTRNDDINGDVTVASLSQILLQLRSSYEVQMSIQSLLSGWSNASGMAVRVEMV